MEDNRRLTSKLFSIFTVINAFVALGLFIFATNSFAVQGYFQLHNIMSLAQKTIPNNRFFNDANLNLQAREQNTGHVVNTTFSNDGGMAGCGIPSTLVEYIYHNIGSADYSKNYIALNVYSQVIGYDPKAPNIGQRGYLTGSSGNDVAYPNIRYHRNIPSIYPAYIGTYNNGLSCGRWVEADLDTQLCNDRNTPDGISKFCPNVSGLTYTGQRLISYVHDSCEDNNGWCRDDAAHIDISLNALNPAGNYYLQWKFIRNPYYTDPKSPAWIKDVWLAWFGTPSRYWSYVTVLNAENGVSNLVYNVGDINNPMWINSHVLGGDNNITWNSGSNNGLLWQIEPVNAAIDANPPANPLYQIRMFDHLGYPVKNGTIYQFHLLFTDGTFGNGVVGYYLFYQGGLPVKPGAQNTTLISPPSGAGQVSLNFNNLLPNNVSLDATKPNYLHPVLMSEAGFTWEPKQCTASQCIYANVPVTGNYHLFAHYIEEASNDLTVRKVNDVLINTASISFANGSNATSYTLKTNDMNLSTLYAARVKVPLTFNTSNTIPVNGNLQALFIPNVTKNNLNNITAQTQGCYLNTYVNVLSGVNGLLARSKEENLKHNKNHAQVGNYTMCTLYYTVNKQSNFASSGAPPAAAFDVIVPQNVGIPPINFSLASPYRVSIQVIGYNPSNTAQPMEVAIPSVNYLASNSASRSIYFILDAQSDPICLQNLNTSTGVTVSLGTKKLATLTKADLPVESQLMASTSPLSLQVNLLPNAEVTCMAMSGIEATTAGALKPGFDVVDPIRLMSMPKPAQTKLGITASATGDTPCLAKTDTLIFSDGVGVAAQVPYTTNAAATKVGVQLPAGNYTIRDKPFNVSGGSCQLASNVAVVLQNNVFVPVTLRYKFNGTPTSNCIAKVQVPSTWPNGCNVVIDITAGSPLKDVTLLWPKGLYEWTHAQVWGGLGSLVIPPNALDNVVWTLPAWINGQGQTVGMTVTNDSLPAICAGFSMGGIKVNCTGTAT